MNKKNIRKALKKFAKTTQTLSEAATELWLECEDDGFTI